VGDIVGALVAGALLMMVAGLVSLVSPAATPVVVFSAIVVALLFRPRGLISRRTG
jgi:branched-subunit amino acid ABC-type transport system permease component